MTPAQILYIIGLTSKSGYPTGVAMKGKLGISALLVLCSITLVASTASADWGGAHGRRSSSSGVSKPKAHVGVTGNMLFYPEVIISGDMNGSGMAAFSGGLSFILEGYPNKYLAAGLLLDVNFQDYKNVPSVDWVEPQISLDISLRPTVPLGSKGRFELYFRLAVGYTAFIPSRAVMDAGATLDDSEHGWNVKLLPGFAVRVARGLTLNAELGWVGCGFLAAGSHVFIHSPALNFGIGYTF